MCWERPVTRRYHIRETLTQKHTRFVQLQGSEVTSTCCTMWDGPPVRATRNLRMRMLGGRWRQGLSLWGWTRGLLADILTVPSIVSTSLAHRVWSIQGDTLKMRSLRTGRRTDTGIKPDLFFLSAAIYTCICVSRWPDIHVYIRIVCNGLYGYLGRDAIGCCRHCELRKSYAVEDWRVNWLGQGGSLYTCFDMTSQEPLVAKRENENGRADVDGGLQRLPRTGFGCETTYRTLARVDGHFEQSSLMTISLAAVQDGNSPDVERGSGCSTLQARHLEWLRVSDCVAWADYVKLCF